ncbi:MAG: SRPBCC domain-containing protein [Pseudomonadales bacterium]
MSSKLTSVKGRGAVRRLQTEISVRAPIDRVWSAITDAQQVKHWWAEGQIGAQVGDPIVMENGAALNGTIVVMLAPYIFEFTWHDAPAESSEPQWLEHRTKSLVRFDLVELGDAETLATLTQYSPVIVAVGAAAGWDHLFQRLAEYLHTGQVKEEVGRFERLKQRYAEQES